MKKMKLVKNGKHLAYVDVLQLSVAKLRELLLLGYSIEEV